MMKLLLLAIGLLLVAPRPGSSFEFPGVVPGVTEVRNRDSSVGEAINFPGDPSRPAAPPRAPPREPPRAPTPEVTELPDDLHSLDLQDLNRLNKITDIADFAAMFDLDLSAIPEEDDLGNFSVATRFGDSVEPSELATMANCKPELRTVELDLPQDPQTTYYPTCIRIEQCGGCCFGPLLTCRPTVTKAVKVKVLKTSTATIGSSRRRGGRRRRRENTASYHTVAVTKHTECECGCKVQASDCNTTIHTYYEGECACVCKDRDEKAKCQEQNLTKYWDDGTCSCYCRRPEACGSGEYFSQASCRCEHVLGRSGVIHFEGSEA